MALSFAVLLVVVLLIGSSVDADKFPQSVDCQSMPQSGYKFCDPSLTVEERTSDLVDRLNLTEQIGQTWTIAPAIDRLGIKAYNWRSNCLHGWSASGGHWDSDMKWTVFPASIGLGATFNVDLVKAVGEVTSDEGRALHNLMLAKYNGNSTEAAALNCFSPNVNLFRDPRWGRGQETYGEDPFVLSQIGAAYTHGLQEGSDPHYVKIVACAKHYVAHSGRDNDRATFTANVTMHDLYDTYLPAFKSQIMGAKAGQIMPAYSGVRCKLEPDGAPDCANKFILKTVLREQFGGYNVSVCSDNGGVSEVYRTHHYVDSAELAAAVSINATTDLDLGHDAIYFDNLAKAVQDSLVDPKTIAESVWRNFYWRMRLGDFDPPSMVSYQSIGADHLNTEANQKLNMQAARESIVLLKNQDDALPLKKDLNTIAVLGPNANDSHVLLSNYEGIPSSITTVLEGIQASVSSNAKVMYSPGCSDTACKTKEDFDSALTVAKDADVVIMVMGLSGSLEGEGHDREPIPCGDQMSDTIGLPGCQSEFVKAVASANSRIVLVLINGGPLSIGWEKDNVPAIIEAFYPGAVGGQAVADVLFGDYNPGGRMPVTTVTSEKDLPIVQDYNMSTPPGRTYKYYTGNLVFPFGYGLSYTMFQYNSLMLADTSIQACANLSLSFTVKNTGSMDGDEVSQVYLVAPREGIDYPVPIRTLAGFDRVHIAAGQSMILKFILDPYDLTVVDGDGNRVINPGSYQLFVGGQQPINGMATEGILSANFKVEASGPTMISDCPRAKKCMACLSQ